jgi:hypothetical protein
MKTDLRYQTRLLVYYRREAWRLHEELEDAKEVSQ